eukprot:396672_1
MPRTKKRKSKYGVHRSNKSSKEEKLYAKWYYAHKTKYELLRETECATDSEQELLEDLYGLSDDEFFDTDLFNQKQFMECIHLGVETG